jgi:hypothetical protein
LQAEPLLTLEPAAAEVQGQTPTDARRRSMNAKKTRTAALYGCVTVAYGFWLYMKVEMSKEQYIEYKQFPVSWVMIGLCGLVGIVVATWQAKLGECNVFRRSNGQITWSRVIGVC